LTCICFVCYKYFLNQKNLEQTFIDFRKNIVQLNNKKIDLLKYKFFNIEKQLLSEDIKYRILYCICQGLIHHFSIYNSHTNFFENKYYKKLKISKISFVYDTYMTNIVYQELFTMIDSDKNIDMNIITKLTDKVLDYLY
jgi:signal recognition particle GTPase